MLWKVDRYSLFSMTSICGPVLRVGDAVLPPRKGDLLEEMVRKMLPPASEPPPVRSNPPPSAERALMLSPLTMISPGQSMTSSSAISS
eukprot:Skav211333  [mRNA]  locus=scaffold3120:172114:176512:- [translate_table: standard]